MISGIFHAGSGLGNQLHRYVATRVLAEDKGCEWGMMDTHLFKGGSFMKLDMGIPYQTAKYAFLEKKIIENGVDIRGYDPEFNFIQDNTLIDGEFQDERYFNRRLKDIDTWLKVEPITLPDDLCIIGFRGGEYALFKDLFLPKEYWDTAIEMKRRYKPNMRFEVHTDDPVSAKQFFPEFKVIQNIGINWRSVRYAKHLIIANSSFYIFPALLNDLTEDIIAPRYWARRNTGVWALPQNFYSKFQYI